MKIISEVTHDIVMDSWRRSNNGLLERNLPIIKTLPPQIAWQKVQLDATDLTNITLIGASDLTDLFGELNLESLAKMDWSALSHKPDPFNHLSRVNALKAAYLSGSEFEPAVLISNARTGPFVIIDGNHRLLALARSGLRFDRSVFLGVHEKMAQCVWFRRSFRDV